MPILKLDTQGHWKVGNHALYVPAKGIGVQHTNVTTSNSGRLQNGKMKIVWVRRDVRSVGLVYKYLTGHEVRYLNNLLQGKEFTFTYYDEGEVKTYSAYCAETSYTKESDALYRSEGGLYSDYKANIIEK